MTKLLALAGLACVVACRHPREADPAAFRAIADRMATNVPAPMAVPNCKPDELVGAPMTRRTLLQIDQHPLDTSPELSDWMNPIEFDAPAARVLADSNADESAKRRAAAEMLGVSSYLIYRLDMIAAPMALGVKDLKIGTIGGRLIRYDKTGNPFCVALFTFQNDKDTSDSAIARSRAGTAISPEVVKMLRDDLHQQYLLHAPRPVVPTGG
ncbi:MAG TPA: hypothetical protein VGG28_08650 [Kofleriaceae bacterium]